MEIIHSSGESLDLPKDAKLDMTRYNPFFADLGEQSLPIILPGTPRNKRILGYPDRLDRKFRIKKEHDVILKEGAYQSKARLVILGATSSEIDTCFYLNTGDLYTRLNNVTLTEIFGGMEVNYESVEEALKQMLLHHVDDSSEIFSVFPVAVKDDERGYIILNRTDESHMSLYNAEDRTETYTVDDKEITINVPAGYYITPFLKVNWILKQIFLYLGYKINSNFFTDTKEFRRLVLLNNTVDTIATGKIVITDLLPEMSVKDFLEILRRRFRCEFVANMDSSIDIRLFKDCINMPVCDISDTLASLPEITLTDKKRLVLKQTSSIESDNSGNRLLSAVLSDLVTIVNSKPDIPEDAITPSYYDVNSGNIIRQGLYGMTIKEKVVYANIENIECDISASNLESDTLELTDKLVHDVSTECGDMPFIGGYRYLRSAVTTDSDEEIEGSSEDMSVMLCFGNHRLLQLGDIIAIYKTGNIDAIDESQQITYSLRSYSKTGIYNIFHRSYDMYLRNSLDEVTTTNAFREHIKMQLDECRPILLNNEPYLLQSMEYTVGKKEPSTCILRSLILQQPIDKAEMYEDIFPAPEYYWKVNNDFNLEEYLKVWGFVSPRTIEYIPAPTKTQYDAGGKYHAKTYQCRGRTGQGNEYYNFELNVWLTAHKL